MSGDDKQQEQDSPKPATDIPEVDAEVVEAAPVENAEPFEDPAPEPREEPVRRSFISPGVLFFAGLVVVAIGAGLYWYIVVDKHPQATTSGAAIETADDTLAPEAADAAAPDEKIANAGMTEMKSAPPAPLEHSADFAAATTGLATQADSIENSSLIEDAKDAATSVNGDILQPTAVDETPALSFELEATAPTEGETAPNEPLIIDEGEPATEPLAEDISPTEVLPPDTSLDAVDAPVESATTKTSDPATSDANEGSADDAAFTELQTILASERMRVAALQAEIDRIGSDLAATIEALQATRSDLAAAQESIRTLRAENDDLKEAHRETPLAGAAIALNAIEKAADDGAPFEADLARLSETTSNAGAVAALEPYAGGGAPALGALRADFAAAAREGLAAANRENADGVVERYGARIGGLFNIRPAAPQPGDAPAAIISRAEYAVEHGALSEAIEELSLLPPSAQRAMEGWTSRAQARVKIDNALRLLNAELVEKAAQPGSL